MKTAAVSELKASLSEYLSKAKAKAGEEVIVTDRGKPIARLVPLKRSATEMPARLLQLERAGRHTKGKYFACLDQRLSAAARNEGFTLLPEIF